MGFAATGTTLVSGSVPLVSALAFAPVLVGAAAVMTLRAEAKRLPESPAPASGP